jgi:hypothetical protein
LKLLDRMIRIAKRRHGQTGQKASPFLNQFSHVTVEHSTELDVGSHVDISLQVGGWTYDLEIDATCFKVVQSPTKII